MHPVARQLLGWQAADPERLAAALVLEVKGDFCHDIQHLLVDHHRGEDYLEVTLDGRVTWNPLSATWLDSYSLAYTVASLLNQLFGKGKEPFWQQAYTNLVRWIIELYRCIPPKDGSGSIGWVTLRDVYHCAIDKTLFDEKIKGAQKIADGLADTWIMVSGDVVTMPDHGRALRALRFVEPPDKATYFRGLADTHILAYLADHQIPYQAERHDYGSAQDLRLRVEAVNRWYQHDGNRRDNKIRSSIVEGISVFLSMFDLPAVARVLCPSPPWPRPADAAPTGSFVVTVAASEALENRRRDRDEPPGPVRPLVGVTAGLDLILVAVMLLGSLVMVRPAAA